MSELLDSAIDEIERVLLGNKDRSVEEVYLKNAIRFIREFSSQSPLNDNKKDLVVWIQDNECSTDDPLESISDLFFESMPSEYCPDAPLSCVEAAYQSLSKKQKLELVQGYVKNALEQEEK